MIEAVHGATILRGKRQCRTVSELGWMTVRSTSAPAARSSAHTFLASLSLANPNLTMIALALTNLRQKFLTQAIDVVGYNSSRGQVIPKMSESLGLCPVPNLSCPNRARIRYVGLIVRRPC